jgi:pteridine reductase
MTQDQSANQSPPYQVALVTGAARRIGAAICRVLHADNWQLVIHCNRSLAAAEALAEELNQVRPNSAQVVQADLNKMVDIQFLASAASAAWGRLDALVNNASTFFPTAIPGATEEQWDNLLGSNLKAPFFLSQALYPELSQRRGCIINISDIFAVRPMPGHTIYSIAKAGNSMLTKSLALEMAPQVRVNGVAPGAMLWPENATGEEMTNPEKLTKIPLGTLGGAEAIANTVKFLIKDSPYITGQILAVDGGRSLQQ